MILRNGVVLRIQKSYYNKTEVQPDGVTHKINTDKKYPMYMLQLDKGYMNVDSKTNVVDCIIKDLQSTIQELQQLKEQYVQDELEK